MKRLVAILAVALLVTGVVATYLWLQLRNERQQSSALQAHVSALEARLAFAFRPATPAAPAPVASSGGPPAADAPAAPDAARQPPARPAAALVAGVREMMSSPEGREMTRNSLRMMLPQQYPDLGKELGLSTEEVNKLFELLARQQSDLVGDALGMQGGANRDPAARQEMQRKVQEMRQANDAELAATLGSKYPQFQSYQQTLPTRQQVTQLQTMLGTSGNALSEAQSKPLMAALVAEQTRIDQDARNAPAARPDNMQEYLEQQAQRTAENNRRMVDAASTHLNPQQLDSYKRMLDQQQNLARMISRLGAQGAAAGQAPAAPPAAPN